MSLVGTRVPTIAEVLTREWFFTLGNNIEVVNDGELTEEDQKSDCLRKVRPILNEAQTRCPKLRDPFWSALTSKLSDLQVSLH